MIRAWSLAGTAVSRAVVSEAGSSRRRRAALATVSRVGSSGAGTSGRPRSRDGLPGGKFGQHGRRVRVVGQVLGPDAERRTDRLEHRRLASRHLGRGRRQVRDQDSPRHAIHRQVVDGEVEASRGVGVAEPEGLDEASRLGIQADLGGVDGLVHPHPAMARVSR